MTDADLKQVKESIQYLAQKVEEIEEKHEEDKPGFPTPVELDEEVLDMTKTEIVDKMKNQLDMEQEHHFSHDQIKTEGFKVLYQIMRNHEVLE